MRIGYLISDYPRFAVTASANEARALTACGADLVPLALRREAGLGPPAYFGQPPFAWSAPEGLERYGRLRRFRIAEPPAAGALPRPLWRAASLLPLLRHPLAGPRAMAYILAHGLPKSLLPTLFGLKEIIRREGIDVLYAQGAHTGAQALPAARAAKVPLVVAVRGTDRSVFPKEHPGVLRGLFEGADLFLVRTRAMAGDLEELGCRPEKIRVNHTGVDLDLFRPGRRPASPAGVLNVLSVSRLIPVKGLFDALEAAALARNERPGVAWTVIGEGELRGEIERRIGERKLGGAARVLGPMPPAKVAEELRRADAFLLPCKLSPDGMQEGHPTAVLEASASGLPVVATRHGGIPEAVEDEASGLLVEEGDAAGLAERLVRLADDPELRRRLGKRGREIVEKEYDIRRQAEEALAYLAEAAGQ